MLLALSGGGAWAQKTQVDYWPMQVGNTWTIDTAVDGKSILLELTVVKREATGAHEVDATLEYQASGQEVQTEVYHIDTKGISRVHSGKGGANTITPPIPVLRYPVTYEDSWTWKGAISMGDQTFPATGTLSVHGPEEVVTPAGTFKAARVRLDLTVPGADGTSTQIVNDYWFAPEIGMVRQAMSLGDKRIDGVMSAYHLRE
jgi:hypothetical protein